MHSHFYEHVNKHGKYSVCAVVHTPDVEKKLYHQDWERVTIISASTLFVI